jgi:predicted transcriptional regulator
MVATKSENELKDFHEALKKWAKEKGVGPAHFAKAMNYSYAHAWGLLTGSRPVTNETLGRFLVYYGDAELMRMMKYLPNGHKEVEEI